MSKKERDAFWLDSYKGLIFKVFSLAFTIYNIRLMVSYLGTDIYGRWVTISSIVSWMNAGDFGIGNGLRNEISKLYAQKNSKGILQAVYSTNRLFAFIAAFTFIGIVIIGKVMGIVGIVEEGYFGPLIVMSLFFSTSLFFGRSQSIALGIQKSWYASLANMVGVAVSIVCYKAMSICQITPNLMCCAYIYGLMIIVPLFVVIFLLKTIDLKGVRTDKIIHDKSFVKRVFKSGLHFYILQITSLVLFSTDNVLVEYLFGSAEVTRYSIINQVYTVGTSLYFIVINSFWSGVAIHYETKDMGWITNNIRKLLMVLVAFSVGVLFVSATLNTIVLLWIGDSSINYDFLIIAIFAIYCIFDCLQSVFSNFNYGIGNTKMIMYLGIASAAVNIPLSFLFAKQFEMGIMGIKLGTLASLLPSWIFIIIATYRILRESKLRNG